MIVAVRVPVAVEVPITVAVAVVDVSVSAIPPEAAANRHARAIANVIPVAGRPVAVVPVASYPGIPWSGARWNVGLRSADANEYVNAALPGRAPRSNPRSSDCQCRSQDPLLRAAHNPSIPSGPLCWSAPGLPPPVGLGSCRPHWFPPHEPGPVRGAPGEARRFCPFQTLGGRKVAAAMRIRKAQLFGDRERQMRCFQVRITPVIRPPRYPEMRLQPMMLLSSSAFCSSRRGRCLAQGDGRCLAQGDFDAPCRRYIFRRHTSARPLTC